MKRFLFLFLSLCLLLPLAACGPADPADGTSAPTASDTTGTSDTPDGAGSTSFSEGSRFVTSVEPPVDTSTASSPEETTTAVIWTDPATYYIRLDPPEGFPEEFKTPLCTVWEYPDTPPEFYRDTHALTGVIWQRGDKELWCTGYGGRAAGTDYALLYYTSNGGETWENVTVLRNFAIRGKITGIYVGDDDRGLFTAVMDYTEDCGYPWRFAQIFATDDGRNWHDFLTPPTSTWTGESTIAEAFGDEGTVRYAGVRTVHELWAALRDLRLDVQGDRVQIVCTLEIDGKTVENRLDFN